MKRERYEQIDNIFEQALELGPGARPAFLDRACGSDATLRREVESLLSAYDRAGNFIESPAIEVAARAEARLDDAAGVMTRPRQVGRYNLLSLLGEGGMGEVYLAEDASLGRKVALKFLPERFISDPERVQRFRREARAASALNHPNIVTIYEIGQAADLHFIATELVEGHTLRRRMEAGKIIPKQSIGIAIQAASALAAAHRAGIIHRDIKPENVMVRPDGYVKVLDFGLAKLTEASGGNSADSALDLSTQSGMVLGTINYMSPEQALGQDVDSRTDIFSLGVVLYEMVTGTQPFKGSTPAAVFDAILNKAPVPAIELSPGLPAGLDRVITRALEKDAELRYQTASDVRAELKRLEREIDSAATEDDAPAPARRRVRARRAFRVAALVAVGALAAVLFYLTFARVRDGAAARAPVISNARRLTDQAGEELFPRLSPDGRSVIYASRAAGNWDIYSQRVGGKHYDNLTGDSSFDDTHPAYSPDGERIAFRSERFGGGIFIMGASGESVNRLTNFGYSPCWSPDGKSIVFTTDLVLHPHDRINDPGSLWVVSVATGGVQAPGDRGRWGPAQLVAGRPQDRLLGHPSRRAARHMDHRGRGRRPGLRYR